MGMVIQPSRFASAPVGSAHRYWRVFIATNNGEANYTSVNRVEMYSSALDGGGRIDRCVGGTPIFSTQGGFSGGEPASGAFDDSNATVWVTAGPAANRLNCWIGYDFGSPIEIDRFALQARGTSLTQTPKGMSLQWSDDNVTWTTLFTTADQTGWAVNEQRLFVAPSYAPTYTGSPHGAHRYWRIHCARANSGGGTFALAEVEFRATPGGSDLTGSGTPSAHSEFSPPTYDAAKAFDNNNATLWSANGGTSNGWLKYDFGSGGAVSVAEVMIRARNDSSFSQTPRYGQIEFSDDNANWSTAWSFALAAFTTGSSQATTDPAYV